MSTNAEAARELNEIADILDVLGEKFKPEAYRRAARSIETLGEDLRRVSDRGGLDQIAGVGDAIAAKLHEFLTTGKIPYLEGLRRQLPAGLIDLMRLPGVGPKTARRFWVELGIEGPAELATALEAGRLVGVKGFGERKIDLLKEAVTQAAGQRASGRMPLRVAWQAAQGILQFLRTETALTGIEAGGSLRRRKENIGDLDILATGPPASVVFDAMARIPGLEKVVLRGGTKMTVMVAPGLQVDVRVVEPEAFGAALQYFTGSKDHNIHLRSIAREKGFKVNEYGVWREERRVAGATEEEVYRALGLRVMPPEIRENRGEIEAAAAGKVPSLISLSDLKGDMHVHLARAPTPEVLAEWKTAALSLHLRYLGLVVPAEHIATTFERIDAANAGGDSVRFHVGVEFPVPSSGPWPELPPKASFGIGRPDSEGPPAKGPSAGIPPVLLGHLALGDEGQESDPVRSRLWLDFAKARGMALDVSSRVSREGLDSASARNAGDQGLGLALTASAERPAELALLEVAVGLARRGGVSPQTIINASESFPAAARPATARRPR